MVLFPEPGAPDIWMKNLHFSCEGRSGWLLIVEIEFVEVSVVV